MKKVKNTESGDFHLGISAKRGYEGLKERFFELNVLYAVRNNLNRAIEVAQQHGQYTTN